MLFPGARHRHAPDRRTGWVEHWIECRGSAFNFGCDAGSAQPERPSSSEISDLFTSIHALAQHDTARNQPRISTLGLQLLALLCRPTDINRSVSGRLVGCARMILMERCSLSLSVEQFAEELGVSYLYFRRLFRAQTGMSAKQYQMTVRIQRASDFLVNTGKSIKQIVGLLAFHSITDQKLY
ncbi:AraC family transcriptional regulator (plasmid) [Rhizobium indigoferae]|uniref:AraC family transcriptional regulator n=1 Tax=Rhizobium indigoferae TaxID=158891 RepID=A0ABZ1DUK5_9HYPH|nr:helix-turn-helix domain-containing protein [Rhizobium indigoferae]WRW39098.1 AraC family transcriptional regulator [Rhizobium indigoferae]